MIKVKELIEQLQKLDPEQYIEVSSDEEWNNIYTDFQIEQNGEHGAYVIFGLSGSEVESWEDVSNNKYDRKID